MHKIDAGRFSASAADGVHFAHVVVTRGNARLYVMCGVGVNRAPLSAGMYSRCCLVKLCTLWDRQVLSTGLESAV